jgi:hypothetical protein
MKKLICTLSMAALLVQFAAAGEKKHAAPVEEAKPASSPAPAPAGEGDPAQLEVKNKSSFTMDESGRNPFWPIGWRPASKVATTQVQGDQASSDIPPSAFLVSSITVDTGGRFAIINGKVMNEGQVFGLQMGNQTYQLTVKAIQDGQVILGRRDQEIVVPLRRR